MDQPHHPRRTGLSAGGVATAKETLAHAEGACAAAVKPIRDLCKTSEEKRMAKKCAKDGDFAKVSVCVGWALVAHALLQGSLKTRGQQVPTLRKLR